MNRMTKLMVQLALVVVVIIIGILGAGAMASKKSLPEPQEKEVIAPLVNIVSVSKTTETMTIIGYGTVEPRMEVQVVPQVSGRVESCHDQFVGGGFFAANTPLVTIEQRDYQIALQAAQAAVAQAEVKLASEEAEADIAKKEWQSLNPGKKPDSILVYREPQVHSARAQLRSAQAQLEKAQLDLERTEIHMPFAGRVVMANADLGQFVTQGQPIGSVYSTDLVEITVPLEDRELAWFAVPRLNTDAAGATATVETTFAGQTYTWSGEVVRMKSRIDAKSRLVHVVVQVVDPFATGDGQMPLLPGSFVTVRIQGKQINDVISIPRHAVHDGRQVWIAEIDPNEGGEIQNGFKRKRLRVKPVTLLRQDRERAYIQSGLDDGAQVIVTPLDMVTKDMWVRIREETGN